MTYFFDKSNAYQYLLSTSDRFNQICKPLQILGVPHFAYMKIFDNGTYLFLSNNLEYRKAYFNTIRDMGPRLTKMLTCSNIISPINNNYRYTFLPHNVKLFNKNQDLIPHLAYDFNIWTFLGISKNNPNSVEYYYFSMDRKENFEPQFYVSYLSLFEHFIDYFNEKAADLIDTSDYKKLTVFEQQFNFSNLSQEKQTYKKRKQFLEETKIHQRIVVNKGKEVKLSTRESQCLLYLSSGHNIKKIAKILDLSPRTIEFYLRNARQKTGLLNKSAILSRFIERNTLLLKD